MSATPATIVLPPPATPHLFRRVTLPGEDNTLDYISVRADATCVKGLPDLNWKDSSAVHASTRAVPLLALAGVICLPAFVEDITQAWARTMMQLKEITVLPDLALLNRCADACDSLKLFNVPVESTIDWEAKLEPALARTGTPSPFALRLGELVEANAFEVPGRAAVAARPGVARVPAVRARRGVAAVAAVPAIPAVATVPAVVGRKPVDLVWWSLVTVQDAVDTSSVFPFLALWRRGCAAPDRTSISARDDPMSRVQALAAILSKHLGSILNDDAARDGQRARAMRLESSRLRTLPDALRSGSFDADVLQVEALHDHSYSKKTSQQDGVTAARLLFGARTYPEAVAYLSRLSSVASRRDTVIDLTAVMPARFASASLFARLDPLETFLKLHSALIVQLINSGTPLDGPSGVTALLLKEHAEWGPDGAHGTSGAGAWVPLLTRLLVAR
jgi:hypothetical protein